MRSIVAIGEIMMRLAAPNHKKLTQTDFLDIVYGGGEANVAVSLSNFGIESKFVTKLPDNPLGENALNFLRQNGVNVDSVIFGGERLGLYFIEQGFSIRPSKVIYDRKHSSFSESTHDEYDFDEIFSNVDCLHISGITPALSDKAFELTKKAVQKAKEKGLKISVDLNYRSTLWDFQEARDKMSEILPMVDLCFGMEPIKLLDENGIDIKDGIDLRNEEDSEVLKDILSKIHKTYGIEYIAFTQRRAISSNKNKIKSFLSTGEKLYETEWSSVEIIDRVGAGDAFTAGIIYGLMSEMSPMDTLEFANEYFALKHTVLGDVVKFDVEEIKALVKKGNKEIQR